MKLPQAPQPDSSHRTAVEATGFRSVFMGGSGALAIGALSVGAGAIGALAIGRLAIGSAHFKRMRIDELEVGSLTVESDYRPGAAALAPSPAPEGSGPARLAAGSSKISHVDLVISSLAKSLPFYRDLLAPLGWDGHDTIEGERGEEVHYISVAGSGVAALGLREAQSDAHPAPYDRYALGVHHVCIDVPSRGLVDERAAWVAADARAEVLSGPATHEYTPGYYAVFLSDPDGIKIELLHRPGYWDSAGAA